MIHKLIRAINVQGVASTIATLCWEIKGGYGTNLQGYESVATPFINLMLEGRAGGLRQVLQTIKWSWC